MERDRTHESVTVRQPIMDCPVRYMGASPRFRQDRNAPVKGLPGLATGLFLYPEIGENMRGTLYGVGVGPGDPELMTLKAARRIREAEIVVVPAKPKTESAAYRIATKAIPELAGKPVLELDWPMTKDRKALEAYYRSAAKEIEALLDQGKNAAFLTLGDPTVYATYLYLHRLVEADGYPVEIVSGVPSFCAAAAKLGIGLAENSEELHIFPASYPDESLLRLPGTKVLMKPASALPEIRRRLAEDKEHEVFAAVNCGMEGERLCRGAESIPDDAGYFTLMIVKEKQEKAGKE